MSWSDTSQRLSNTADAKKEKKWERRDKAFTSIWKAYKLKQGRGWPFIDSTNSFSTPMGSNWMGAPKIKTEFTCTLDSKLDSPNVSDPCLNDNPKQLIPNWLKRHYQVTSLSNFTWMIHENCQMTWLICLIDPSDPLSDSSHMLEWLWVIYQVLIWEMQVYPLGSK